MCPPPGPGKALDVEANKDAAALGTINRGISRNTSVKLVEDPSWRAELKQVVWLAAPVIIQTASQQAMLVTDQMFLGRLGTVEMAAAALGNTWLNLQWFFLLGTSTALDTLGSQAYGAGDHTALVTWCFTAFLVLSALCIPVSVGLGAGAAAARTFFGQDDLVAAHVGRFCQGLVPGMWPLMWSLCLMKYLQTQNVMALPAAVTLLAFFINIASNAILVPRYGFVGSPAATSLTRFLQFFMLVAVVYWYEHKRHSEELAAAAAEQHTDIAGCSNAGASASCSSSSGHTPSSAKPDSNSSSSSRNGGGYEACASNGGADTGGGGGDSVIQQKKQQQQNGSGSMAGVGVGGVTGRMSTPLRFVRVKAAAVAGTAWGAVRQLTWKVRHKPHWSLGEVAQYTLAQTKAALSASTLLQFLKIGIPGGLMMSFEGGAFDITTAMAGRLGAAPTAAHNAMLLIVALTFCSCPLPLATAASIRVGNLLGAGCPRTARISGYLTVSIGTFFMTLSGVMLLCFRNQLGEIYTSDQEVIGYMSSVAPFAALFQASDGLMGTSQGVLRGCGRQHQLMFFNLFGFWVCGVLLGSLLCFKAHMGLRGLWVGIAVGDTVTAFLTFGCLLCVNWIKETRLAQDLAAANKADSADALPLLGDAAAGTNSSDSPPPNGELSTLLPVHTHSQRNDGPYDGDGSRHSHRSHTVAGNGNGAVHGSGNNNLSPFASRANSSSSGSPLAMRLVSSSFTEGSPHASARGRGGSGIFGDGGGGGVGSSGSGVFNVGYVAGGRHSASGVVQFPPGAGAHRGDGESGGGSGSGRRRSHNAHLMGASNNFGGSFGNSGDLGLVNDGDDPAIHSASQALVHGKSAEASPGSRVGNDGLGHVGRVAGVGGRADAAATLPMVSAMAAASAAGGGIVGAGGFGVKAPAHRGSSGADGSSGTKGSGSSNSRDDGDSTIQGRSVAVTGMNDGSRSMSGGRGDISAGGGGGGLGRPPLIGARAASGQAEVRDGPSDDVSQGDEWTRLL